jgi:four helix bundle protein
MSEIQNYRDLEIWKRSMNLCVHLYQLTNKFPQAEQYGLTNQLRRSAVSIPSNIAEGHVRSRREFVRFLRIARGSLNELETQLEIAHRIGYLTNEDLNEPIAEMKILGRQLNTLLSKIQD